MQWPGLPHTGEYLMLCPLQVPWDKKNMAQMKEQIKTPEKIQLSDEEIANLSNAEFKTLVIRVLRELIEPSLKMKENWRLPKVK